MNYLLIYCYITNQYHLIQDKEISRFIEPELLFEFEEDELRIAKKVLKNLEIEQASRQQKETMRRAA